MKKKLNGAQKWMIAYIVIALIAIIHPFTCRTEAGIKGNVKINLVLKESENKVDKVENFGELESKNYVPENYELAAIGSFETSVLTVKCSYDFIIRCAESVCRENNYSGFGLINIKRPGIINTCYQSDIVFFIALK
jgi:hypothetical protein